MHTIRWRSGATDSGQIPCLPMLGLRQCALSPFSSLLLSAESESLSEYLSSAWRLPLCLEPVTDYNVVPIYHRFRGERDDAQVASALGALGPRAKRAQNTRRTCCFRRRDRRVLKQRVGPERGGAKFKHYYARWRPVRAVGAWFRACSDGCSTKRAEAFG